MRRQNTKYFRLIYSKYLLYVIVSEKSKLFSNFKEFINDFYDFTLYSGYDTHHIY
jgi:hypothetical protein